MKIFEYKNFKVVCDTYSKSNSWGHTAVVFKDDYELSRSKIRYYNRTWECYTYQSVILDALYDAIKSQQSYLITTYKDKNNVSRITKNKKDEILECDKELIELNDVYNYFKSECKG